MKTKNIAALVIAVVVVSSVLGMQSAHAEGLTCHSSDNQWIYCPYDITVYNPRPQARSEWVYGDKATCWRWADNWYTCEMLGHSAFIAPIGPIPPIPPIAPIAPIAPIFPVR
jgi:hypothetical protein